MYNQTGLLVSDIGFEIISDIVLNLSNDSQFNEA